MRLKAPQITSRRLLLPRPTIPQRRTRPLPRRRPSPLPFILHVPVGAKDGALAASSSPDVTVGTAEGATAAAASAAGTGMDADTDTTPSFAVGSAQDGTEKKRRRKRNHTARASRKHRQRVAGFTAARSGNTGPESNPDEEHSAGEWGEW